MGAPVASMATKVMKPLRQSQISPVLGTSPCTLTSISTLVRKAATTRASTSTTWPTLMGRSKAISSMPAVTATAPQWRWAQIEAQTSIQARTWPPKTLPSALAWVGSTYSVILVDESAGRRGAAVVMGGAG